LPPAAPAPVRVAAHGGSGSGARSPTGRRGPRPRWGQALPHAKCRDVPGIAILPPGWSRRRIGRPPASGSRRWRRSRAPLRPPPGGRRSPAPSTISPRLRGRCPEPTSRAFAGGAAGVAATPARPALELAGEALAAVLDEAHAASDLARVAANVVGAPVGLLWELTDDGLELAGAHGLTPELDLAPVRKLAEAALDEPGPLRAVPAETLPGGCGVSTSLPLGRPPAAVLQLLHAPSDTPGAEQLARLPTFGVRAAQALRASADARTLGVELKRTRALLAVVGQATAEL